MRWRSAISCKNPGRLQLCRGHTCVTAAFGEQCRFNHIPGWRGDHLGVDAFFTGSMLCSNSHKEGVGACQLHLEHNRLGPAAAAIVLHFVKINTVTNGTTMAGALRCGESGGVVG